MEGQPRWTGVFVVKTGLRAVPWTVVAEEWLSMEYMASGYRLHRSRVPRGQARAGNRSAAGARSRRQRMNLGCVEENMDRGLPGREMGVLLSWVVAGRSVAAVLAPRSHYGDCSCQWTAVCKGRDGGEQKHKGKDRVKQQPLSLSP